MDLGILGEKNNHRATKAFHISAFVFIGFWLANFITWQVAYGIGLCWPVCKASLCTDETKGILVLFERIAEKEQLAENPEQAIV